MPPDARVVLACKSVRQKARRLTVGTLPFDRARQKFKYNIRQPTQESEQDQGIQRKIEIITAAIDDSGNVFCSIFGAYDN